jgi:hypothetical protein
VSLVGEADQIKRILGSIVVNAQANLPKNEGAPKLRTREITKDK